MSVMGDFAEITAPQVFAAGALADIPAGVGDGSFYSATDQAVTYVMLGGVWTRTDGGPGRVTATFLTAADTGCVLLQGQAVSRIGIYEALFAKWGTTFGAGDGATTFNVPDCQGYTLAGKKTSGAFNLALGAAVGEETHALLTAELPAHNHAITGTPALTGAPSLTGVPGHTGSFTLTGSPSLSGAPSLSGSPSASDPGHTHSFSAMQATGTVSSPGGSGGINIGSEGSDNTGSHTTGISVGSGTLSVSSGSLSVAVGTLAVGAGTFTHTIGTLAAAIGSLASTLGTLATSNTGTGTAHNNVQPSRVVNWQAKL